MCSEEVPDLQLAFVGSRALDNPEEREVYREIEECARQDPDVGAFTNLTVVGNVEVNAFVGSEALWKRTPVVAGGTGPSCELVSRANGGVSLRLAGALHTVVQGKPCRGSPRLDLGSETVLRTGLEMLGCRRLADAGERRQGET